MRRFFITLFVLFAGIFLLTSCQRENALQIVSVNDNEAILADLTDFGVYRDPTDPEAEPEFVTAIPDDVIPIELCYREIGIGLPTWRPYTARLTKVRVTFSGVMGDVPDELPPVDGRVNILVQSDPAGKKTVKGYITLMPAVWKTEVFGGGAADPTEVEEIAVLRAKIRLEGVDEATGEAVSAETEVLVSVGEFWDDESRIGQ